MQMKKIIVLTILFCGVIPAYSQTDSLFLNNYDQKIRDNNKLINDLQTEKQNFSDLYEAYKKDTLALQKQIKDLRNEVSSEKQKVSDLNNNKVKEERDNLQTKVDSLITVISKLNQTIADNDKQIEKAKANSITSADKAKNDGKAEALASIVNSYKNRPFDDLIKSSTKGSVDRDMQLVGNNPEVKPVLNDLQIYFNAQELLSEKFDAVKIKNAQTQLNQINRQSKLLDALKEDVDFYQNFKTALKETISKLVNLDKRKSADGDPDIQKLKFNDIVTILTDYIYNYYDYTKYPYLSDIVLEIIKRKQPNADADITDLLIKL
jgi:peptidoglycan hydrolase CwlO-like protein